MERRYYLVGRQHHRSDEQIVAANLTNTLIMSVPWLGYKRTSRKRFGADV